MTENEKVLRRLEVMTLRQDSIERVQKMQHEEIGKLHAAVKALQDALDAAVAPPAN